MDGQVVCILNRVPVSILLMLNSSGRTGGMFNQMNKVSNFHTHAHLLLVTGWPQKMWSLPAFNQFGMSVVVG